MASEKITAMIEEVKALSVLELNELVKALEEEFGVSAAAVAAAPAAGAGAAGRNRSHGVCGLGGSDVRCGRGQRRLAGCG